MKQIFQSSAKFKFREFATNKMQQRKIKCIYTELFIYFVFKLIHRNICRLFIPQNIFLNTAHMSLLILGFIQSPFEVDFENFFKYFGQAIEWERPNRKSPYLDHLSSKCVYILMHILYTHIYHFNRRYICGIYCYTIIFKFCHPHVSFFYSKPRFLI